jgi:hypothetical protein
MPAVSPTSMVTIIVSLCVGGAVGAGLTRIVFLRPMCVAAPEQWSNPLAAPPLNEPGKTYR